MGGPSWLRGVGQLTPHLLAAASKCLWSSRRGLSWLTRPDFTSGPGAADQAGPSSAGPGSIPSFLAGGRVLGGKRSSLPGPHRLPVLQKLVESRAQLQEEKLQLQQQLLQLQEKLAVQESGSLSQAVQLQNKVLSFQRRDPDAAHPPGDFDALCWHP